MRRRRPAAPGVTISSADRAAAASKFVGTSSAVTPEPHLPSVPSAAPRAVASNAVAPRIEAPAHEMPSHDRTSAAAAGAGTGARVAAVHSQVDAGSSSNSDSGARFISDFEVSVPESQATEGPVLSSAAVALQEPEHHAPRVAVDPMMAEAAASSSARSFSDLAEMPPLKEPVFAPEVPELAEPLPVAPQSHPQQEEKPKIQAREVAEKAFQQIATVPPRLMLFSILGALALMLVVAIAIFFHVRSEDDGSTVAPRPTKATSQSSAPVAQAPAPPSETASAVPPFVEPQPTLKVRQIEKHSAKGNRRAPAPPPRRLQPYFQARRSSTRTLRVLSFRWTEKAIPRGLLHLRSPSLGRASTSYL